MYERVKIAVHVPEAYAEKVRQVIGEAGGGRVGNYSFCSFTVKGVGRFKPETGANPSIGMIGKLEEVVEDRIEVVCEREIMEKVVSAIKSAHPYEEPAIELSPLI